MFLGLDQSYNSFGYVMLDAQLNMVDFGTIKTKKTDGDHFDRCNIIATKINEYAKMHNPTAIAIEGLAFGIRGDATRDLAGLQFVIMTLFRNNGFNPSIIPPLTLKKFATGNGKADKVAMANALPPEVLLSFQNKNYKKTTGLYDLSDAYFLAKHAATINK